MDSRSKVAINKHLNFVLRQVFQPNNRNYLCETRQSTHCCVFRQSSPLSYVTVSRARTGTRSLRRSSAPAPHTSVSPSTAACHKFSPGSAPANRHETALPLPTHTLLPARMSSVCVCVCERERERDRETDREREREEQRRRKRFNHQWIVTHTHTHTHTH